jgi:hypothetical protein
MTITPIPNVNKPITISGCHKIYWNILKCLDNKVSSPFIIRELWQTQRCDQIASDFSDIRSNINEHLKNEQPEDQIVNRLLSIRHALPSDNESATQSIMHYHSELKSKLIKSLSWNDWIYYHSFYQVERFVGSIKTITK